MSMGYGMDPMAMGMPKGLKGFVATDHDWQYVIKCNCQATCAPYDHEAGADFLRVTMMVILIVVMM